MIRSMASQKVYRYVNDAELLYKSLNGVFLIKKPRGVHFNQMRETVISNLCRDLNDMKVRPPLKYVAIEGDTTSDMKVTVRDSFADHILVVGPRYQPNNFRFAASKMMGLHTSGIIVCGVNNANRIIHQLRDSKAIRFYKVKGLLGQATHNYFYTGRIIEKSVYAHVKRGHIDKLCSSMQSSHQRKMFELCGVDIQSQAAYELALKGPIRPANTEIPMIYTIKCVDFSPPEFTLEIVCTSEYDMYLRTIIHDLGLHLRSNATCTQILCIKDSLFSIEDALLPKDWNLKNIVKNMQMCENILDQNKSILDPESSALQEANC